MLRQFEVTFTPLESALPLLRRRNHVRAYLGSAEILGTLAFEETPHEAKPISGVLSLRRAAATYPGEAFVVRRLSPKDLLGGGTVGAGVVSAQTDDDGALDPEQQSVLAVLTSLGIASGIATTIAARANLREERTVAILETLVERGLARKLAKPVAFVDGAAADDLYARALSRDQHRAP